MPWNDFAEPLEALKIGARLKALTPVSVKSGKSPWGIIDNPIVRRLDGQPYIPGSSIKGALRSEAERLASALNLPVCNILTPDGEENGELTLRERLKEKYEPCIVCKIFGGPTTASHVTVFDAVVSEGSYAVAIRRSVAINRITGAQHTGRLFDTEFLEPGSELNWQLWLENINPLKPQSDMANEDRIFAYLLEKLCTGGIFVGGRRSVGMGKIKMAVSSAFLERLEEGRIVREDVTGKFKRFEESMPV